MQYLELVWKYLILCKLQSLLPVEALLPQGSGKDKSRGNSHSQDSCAAVRLTPLSHKHTTNQIPILKNHVHTVNVDAANSTLIYFVNYLKVSKCRMYQFWSNHRNDQLLIVHYTNTVQSISLQSFAFAALLS